MMKICIPRFEFPVHVRRRTSRHLNDLQLIAGLSGHSPCKWFSLLLLIAAFFSSSLQAAEDTEARESTWRALKAGKAVALMRHALAPGIGDPADFALGDCSTQRNLSGDGRLQAENAGRLLRENGITRASVETSAWCRCVDTALLLGFDSPVVNPALNSVFRDMEKTRPQSDQVRESMEKWLAEPDIPKILVTHQVNIRALTGQSISSGNIQVVTLQNNELVVLDTILVATPR